MYDMAVHRRSDRILSDKLYPTWLLIDDEIEFYLVWKYLPDARYVIKSVICDSDFERLVLGCIEADFCK